MRSWKKERVTSTDAKEMGKAKMALTLKSAVVSICRESGLQCTSVNPADPSSILHVHSGCSKDHTCEKGRTSKAYDIQTISLIKFYLRMFVGEGHSELYRDSFCHNSCNKPKDWRETQIKDKGHPWNILEMFKVTEVWWELREGNMRSPLEAMQG